MKRKRLIFLFLGTYIVLLLIMVLVAVFDNGDTVRTFGLSLLYGGFGVAAVGFLILRGATAIGAGLGARMRKRGIKTHSQRSYEAAQKEDESQKMIDQVVWMVIFGAILASFTGCLILRL